MPRKILQPPDGRGAVDGRLLDDFQLREDAGILLHPLPQKLGSSKDCAENIVEVVRYPGSHFSEGAQLFRFDQLFLSVT